MKWSVLSNSRILLFEHCPHNKHLTIQIKIVSSNKVRKKKEIRRQWRWDFPAHIPFLIKFKHIRTKEQ